MNKSILSLKRVAEILGVSEKTIYRMVADNQIPCAVKIGGQWRFKADEVMAWIDSQKQPDVTTHKKEDLLITLVKALENGAVLYRIHAKNSDEILDELVAALPNSANFNAKGIKRSVMFRESIVSSSMDGIAWMRPDPSMPVYQEKTMVILAYFEHPVDCRAIDRQLTELLFLVLPANAIELAIIERRLWRMSMSTTFVDGIRKQLTRKQLIDFIVSQEETLFQERPAI